MERDQDRVQTARLIYQIQPWLEVERPSSAVVVYSRSREHAEASAAELATRLDAMRHELKADLHSVEEFAARAASPQSSKPVILVDSSNAGAPGDSAAVLGVLTRSFPSLRAATIIADPAAVETVVRRRRWLDAEVCAGRHC